jgi:hypothetical protein
MGVINITGIRTADPADIWTPLSAFYASSPFAIVIDVQLEADPPYLDDIFDITWIMGTPRMDPFTTSWYSVAGDTGWIMPTIVFEWDRMTWNYRQKGKDFTVWTSFDHYSDAVSQILGGEKYEGIFYVQGTVAALGTTYFAVSEKFWYRAMGDQ